MMAVYRFFLCMLLCSCYASTGPDNNVAVQNGLATSSTDDETTIKIKSITTQLSSMMKDKRRNDKRKYQQNDDDDIIQQQSADSSVCYIGICIDPPPVELPDGYTRKDFLTGDETWKCPYPDCMVTYGAGKGKPRIFDSSSTGTSRRMHVSRCRKEYEKTRGASAKCGFERLGRPNNGEYFHLTCARCQEAGEHRPSIHHGSWLDLGETTEVGLPCNENEDNEADSSDGSDTETEDWDLAHVYTIKEMEKEERQMCEEDNCDRVACCRWESDNDQWFLCLDCQARVFEGPTWPDEMPIDYMSEDHRNYIATHCSDNLDPDMPDLPTCEESEEGSSESESEEESSESEASEESSDEDSEEEYTCTKETSKVLNLNVSVCFDYCVST